jgi:hypothetical protein
MNGRLVPQGRSKVRHYRAVANKGGTGHWPVPSGDPPDGTGEALCLHAETVFHRAPPPLSRAGSPAERASGPCHPCMVHAFAIRELL